MVGPTCSRRRVLSAGAASIVLPLGARLAGAAPAQEMFATDDLLDRLRRAGSVRVGIVNQPPYSGLNPDGSVTGVATTMVEAVMKRLGVPRLDCLIAPYSQMIPGLEAHRWDMIGASLTITKERCSQIAYSDPVAADGAAIAYYPAALGAPPKSLAEAVRRRLAIGVVSGSYLIKKFTALKVDPGLTSIFPDNTALIDGLRGGRVQIAVSPSLAYMKRPDEPPFSTIYPLPDDPPHGSAPAFRREDSDLIDAFDHELRALKATGTFDAIRRKFGFEDQPELLKETAADFCAGAA